MMNLRFLWVATAIVIPLFSVQYISNENDYLIRMTYIVVATFAEVVAISLAISEFFRAGRELEYLREQQIKADRDNDVSKWRKEFLNDSLGLYEMQKESLKRAKELTGEEVSEARAADESAGS